MKKVVLVKCLWLCADDCETIKEIYVEIANLLVLLSSGSLV